MGGGAAQRPGRVRWGGRARVCGTEVLGGTSSTSHLAYRDEGGFPPAPPVTPDVELAELGFGHKPLESDQVDS